MALAGCYCEVVWARKLAVELGFPQLKSIDIYEDGTGCIALANNMHLRGRSKHVALRVCFIQQLIQDGIINAKQCPTAAQIADIGTKALPRVSFESFTESICGPNKIDCDMYSNMHHLKASSPVCDTFSRQMPWCTTILGFWRAGQRVWIWLRLSGHVNQLD